MPYTVKKRGFLPFLFAAAVLLAALLIPRGEGVAGSELRREPKAAFPLGENLACVSGSGLELLSPDGGTLSMERRFDPELCASDGESLLLVSDGAAMILSGDGSLTELPGEGDVLCTAISGDYAAVSRRSSGYGSAVTFCRGGEAIFTRYTALGECRSVALDGFGGACLALNSGELAFLSGADELCRASAPGAGAVLAIDGGYCAETDGGIAFYSEKGEPRGQYSGAYAGLRAYSGEAYVFTAFTVRRLGADGSVKSEAEFPEGIISPALGETPGAVLPGRCVALGRDLEIDFEFENKYPAKYVITYKNAVAAVWQRAAEIHRK